MKFKKGDQAYKPKGYDFPCTIVSVFKTTRGDIRVVGEMDGYGLLHIFNEDQLEHRPKDTRNYDLTKILTKEMWGCWVALNEDHTKVVGYHKKLAVLDDMVSGEKVVYMKYG